MAGIYEILKKHRSKEYTANNIVVFGDKKFIKKIKELKKGE